MPKLANHMHLPVQSGSDRILALMRRGYTVLEFKQKLPQLRAVRPDIPVSTDFIVGFPGETERDFQQTLDLTEEVASTSRTASSTAAGPARLPHRCPMTCRPK